jgi:AcrR family transcriptional regulator
MEKIDPRKRRTRTMLGQALRNLILEKPYDAITIQEITDKADLNRATFYLHYASKEELLMASLEAQFDELVTHMEAEANGEPLWADSLAAQIIFEYVAENAALFTVLLGEQGQGHVMHRILTYIAQKEEEEMRQVFADSQMTIPIPILSRHFAGSLLSLIGWWLENDMPYSPTYMAETMQQMCLVGVLPIMTETTVA